MLNKFMPFRFWCQKVLPLVYDDSLSYIEVLYKVVDYLNKLGSDFNTLAEAFESLYQYVQQFVDEEIEPIIDAKLEEMLEDGEIEAIVRRLMAMDYVTPDMFGAVGDGDTDDTVAVQLAFRSGRNVCFMMDKIYKITDTIHIDKAYPNSATPEGAAEWDELHEEGVYKIGRTAFSKAPTGSATRNCNILAVFSDVTKPVFSIEVSDWFFDNLSINTATTTNQQLTIFKTNRESNDADVDFYLTNCKIENFDLLFDFTGRGLLVRNCYFAHNKRLINIKWDDNGDSGSTYHNNTTGPRAIRFIGNRIHSSKGNNPFITLTSGSAYGFEFINNTVDRGTGHLLKVYDDIDNWLISGNNFTGMRGYGTSSRDCLMWFDEGVTVSNFVFSNNRISQNIPGESSSSNLFYFTNVMFFEMETNLVNAVITGNVVNRLPNGNFITCYKDDNVEHSSCNIIGCNISNNVVGSITDIVNQRALIRAVSLRMYRTSIVGNVIGFCTGDGNVYAVYSAGTCYIEYSKIIGNSIYGGISVNNTGTLYDTGTLIDDNLMS